MAESQHLTELIQARLDQFFSNSTAVLSEIAPELVDIARAAREATAGGKRFRARFCFWGWRAVADLPDPMDPLSHGAQQADLSAVISIASAIEVLHAAALVHDDVIDRSERRRGAPSVHVRFAEMHRTRGWVREAHRFGTASAILLGDLLLSYADDLLADGIARLQHRDRAATLRTEFSRMRAEVTLGQYLDVLEEHAWIASNDADATQRARRIVVYKSAKYSVQAPLVLGALAAGADPAHVAALREVGLPLGEAFQLRDDLLGVYGDPEVTGKPAGDDLREGKRTVLVALARQALPAAGRSLVDELLGDPELSEHQVDVLRQTFADCGAVDQVERAIEYNVRSAREALARADIAPAARHELTALADAVASRTS